MDSPHCIPFAISLLCHCKASSHLVASLWQDFHPWVVICYLKCWHSSSKSICSMSHFHIDHTVWIILIWFTSGCHWMHSGPTKICGRFLCISVAPSGKCTGKHNVWKHWMCQAMIRKIMIHSESYAQWGMEHNPYPSLHCGLDSLLGFLHGYSLLLGQDYGLYQCFTDCPCQCHTDLNMIF